MARITDAQITDDGTRLLIRIVDGKGKAIGIRIKASELWDQTAPKTDPAEWR